MACQNVQNQGSTSLEHKLKHLVLGIIKLQQRQLFSHQHENLKSYKHMISKTPIADFCDTIGDS